MEKVIIKKIDTNQIAIYYDGIPSFKHNLAINPPVRISDISRIGSFLYKINRTYNSNISKIYFQDNKKEMVFTPDNSSLNIKYEEILNLKDFIEEILDSKPSTNLGKMLRTIEEINNSTQPNSLNENTKIHETVSRFTQETPKKPPQNTHTGKNIMKKENALDYIKKLRKNIKNYSG